MNNFRNRFVLTVPTMSKGQLSTRKANDKVDCILHPTDVEYKKVSFSLCNDGHSVVLVLDVSVVMKDSPIVRRAN